MRNRLAALPDAFDQAGYLGEKKKSDLTNATKREKGFICPLILAEMWSTDYTIFLIKKNKLLTELFCFPVVC